jgi:hypothetical protein
MMRPGHPIKTFLPSVEDIQMTMTPNEFYRSKYPSVFHSQPLSFRLEKPNEIPVSPITVEQKQQLTENVQLTKTDNIVTITCDSGTILFDKRDLIGFQVALKESKIHIVLKSTTLPVPILCIDSWTSTLASLSALLSKKKFTFSALMPSCLKKK